MLDTGVNERKASTIVRTKVSEQSQEAPSAVCAERFPTAVRVVKLHRVPRFDDDDTVGAHAEVPVAQRANLGFIQRQRRRRRRRPAVDHDEVVAGAFVLEKRNHVFD